MPGEHGDDITSDWVSRTTGAIARGDRKALAIFYQAWFDRCFSMARSRTRRDEAFCLDVVQDSMLRVIRSLPRLATRAELEAWMTKAVHSAALDLLRRESRRIKREGARGNRVVLTQDAATNDSINDSVASVLVSMTDLPPDDRTLLGLRVGQGRSLEATGAAVGITGDAAHGRVRRALQKLKKLVKERGHDD